MYIAHISPIQMRRHTSKAIPASLCLFLKAYITFADCTNIRNRFVTNSHLLTSAVPPTNSTANEAANTITNNMIITHLALYNSLISCLLPRNYQLIVVLLSSGITPFVFYGRKSSNTVCCYHARISEEVQNLLVDRK